MPRKNKVDICAFVKAVAVVSKSKKVVALVSTSPLLQIPVWQVDTAIGNENPALDDAKGNPPNRAVDALAVAGYVIAKFAVTNRPILVYVALATVRASPAPDPSVGVHVPCSYQFSNSLVMPGALVFALKSMPLAAVPITRLPVFTVTSPTADMVMRGLLFVPNTIGTADRLYMDVAALPVNPVPALKAIVCAAVRTAAYVSVALYTSNFVIGEAVPTPTLPAVSIVIAVTVLFTPKPKGIALPVVTPLPVVLNIRLSVDSVNCVALTARPAVKFDTATFTVDPPCTIGRTSVPASGVVDAVNAEIFLSAMLHL